MRRSRQPDLWQCVIRVGEHALTLVNSANWIDRLAMPRCNGRKGRWRDAGRVEVGGGGTIVAVMPCRCGPVVLSGQEAPLRVLRRVGCAHGVWGLQLLDDARAAWTLLWSEPALRSRRGLGRWRLRLGVGR